MQKVIVIGGGVASLSAGIYAQRCGFITTIILESHSIADGNCTSWKRKGYLFEGGMHWLTGSDSKAPIHKLWRCVGALDNSVISEVNSPRFHRYFNPPSKRIVKHHYPHSDSRHPKANKPILQKTCAGCVE